MRLAAKTGLAALALALLFALTSGLATAVVPVPPTGATPGETLVKLVVVCALNAAVLVYMLLRCGGSGRQLVGLVFLELFGVAAFMSQNETLYFNAALTVPLAVVASVVVAYAVTAAVFAPLLVWLFGRLRDAEPVARGAGTTREGLLWKTALLAAGVYPALYFLFGYFVLWQLPEARLLYQGSTELVPFPEHMAGVLRSDPWLLPWQVLRGLLWIGLAVPVMRLSRAAWWETGVIVGLLFALLLNAQHLLPNPYMPPPVQLAHFVETAVSNFILGFGIVAVLRP